MLRLILILLLLSLVYWFIRDRILQLHIWLRHDVYWWMFPR